MELTSRKPENEESSLSNLYTEVDNALREAGLLKEKKQNSLNLSSTVLGAREKDIKIAAEKRKTRRKDM